MKINAWTDTKDSVPVPSFELERIAKLVSEGYTSGDLFFETEDGEEARGWWQA